MAKTCKKSNSIPVRISQHTLRIWEHSENIRKYPNQNTNGPWHISGITYFSNL